MSSSLITRTIIVKLDTKTKVMEIKKDAWDNFMDAVDFESDINNFKYEFKIMTKKYGQAYIEYCKAMWSANDGVQTEEEFMKMNGNMPRSFFDKAINKH